MSLKGETAYRKKRITPGRESRWGVAAWLSTIGLLTLVLAAPGTAIAAERVVLGEEFSATW